MTNTLELKDLLWIMSRSVGTTCSSSRDSPLNFTALMLWETAFLTFVCAYYTGEKTWLPRVFLPKGDYLPVQKKNIQSDFKCSFDLLVTCRQPPPQNVHCEPVHTVRTVSLGVALNIVLTTAQGEIHSQCLTQTLLFLSSPPVFFSLLSASGGDALKRIISAVCFCRELFFQTETVSHICHLCK